MFLRKLLAMMYKCLMIKIIIIFKIMKLFLFNFDCRPDLTTQKRENSIYYYSTVLQ
jgi:hypothetical protein